MHWMSAFPELNAIENEKLSVEIRQHKIIPFAKGKHLFREGDGCSSYVLVVSGSIRVYRIGAEGQEILLYRISAGQSCMLTTTCLLGKKNYPAEGVAENDVELVMLPAKLFERLMMDSSLFRQHVMEQISERICDMMLLIEDVAFGSMDQRVARLLLNRAELEGDTLLCTHQELASELGTAREVISRMLKSFEQRGWVALSRGAIVLVERSLLGQIANTESM